jgi:hypothetical protein
VRLPKLVSPQSIPLSFGKWNGSQLVDSLSSTWVALQPRLYFEKAASIKFKVLIYPDVPLNNATSEISMP